jgi:hypothetical protein
VNVRFCGSCRGLILSDFRFCPYCGAEVPRGPGIEEALGGPFSRIEADERARDGRAAGARALADAAESLDRLESDMDRIIEALEREGSSSPK